METDYQKHRIDKSICLNPEEQFFISILVKFYRTEPLLRVFFCGGWVRDKLMNKPTKDIDVIISFEQIDPFLNELEIASEEHQIRFKGQKKTDLSLGICKGLRLVKSTMGSLEIDFREWKSPFSLSEDTQTRDFRCNSFYFNPINQHVLDLVDGYQDLRNNILNSVCSFEITFGKDSGRFFRMVRFSVQKELKINETLIQKIKQHKFVFSPLEESKREYLKIFEVSNPVKCFHIIKDLNLLRVFEKFPNIEIYDDIINLMAKMNKFLDSPFYESKIKPYATCYFSRNKLFSFCDAYFHFLNFEDREFDRKEYLWGKKCKAYMKTNLKVFNELTAEKIISELSFLNEFENEFTGLVFVIRRISETEIKKGEGALPLLAQFFRTGFQKFLKTVNCFKEVKFLFENCVDVPIEDYVFCFFENTSQSEVKEFLFYFAKVSLIPSQSSLKRAKILTLEIAEARYKKHKSLNLFWNFYLQKRPKPADYSLLWNSSQFLLHFFDAFAFFDDKEINYIGITHKRNIQL